MSTVFCTKAQDTVRDEAVTAWTSYCRRFGHAPIDLIGSCYPGLEKYRVDADMAREIAVRLA